MASKKKQPSQGQGRTNNSEPRMQVFKGFQGCNFELSPKEFTLGQPQDGAQSDLQMNYVAIQNNIDVESNLTLSTRPPIYRAIEPPNGYEFTGIATMYGSEIFLVLNNNAILRDDLEDPSNPRYVTIRDRSDEPGGVNEWTEIGIYGDQLVALSPDRFIFTSTTPISEGNNEIINYPKIPAPTADVINKKLEVEFEYDEKYSTEYPNQLTLYLCYTTKLGSTELSPGKDYFFDISLLEWQNYSRSIKLSGTIPSNIRDYVTGVELFYTIGGTTQPLYAAYTDVEDNGNWEIVWGGYSDITDKMLLAHTVAPTENTTQGVKCTHMTTIDGRMYFWKDNRIYVGGVAGHEFSVSTGVGGGYCDVDPLLPVEIEYVDKYKTQSGNDIVTMLCDSKNSTLERRFNLVETTIELDSQTSNTNRAYQAEQVAGAVGCKSRHGGLVCEDGLYSMSRFGLALTTLTMEYNSQIRANYISDPIKPVFVNNLGKHYKSGCLIEADGILYMAIGYEEGSKFNYGNIIFCYDINAKAWWTYTTPEPVLNMIHVDYEGKQEGIGIISRHGMYILPLTMIKDNDMVEFLLETGELSTQMPQQAWQHLSQIEFRFDYFVGDMTIDLIGYDQFGRLVKTQKRIHHDKKQLNLAEYMRVDLKLQSYKLIIDGYADFRLTHWIAKTYTMSNKQGLVYGFDDSQSYRHQGDIHPTFSCYNDIRKAIFV